MIMNRKMLSYFWMSLLLLGLGCQDDKLDEPARVELSIVMTSSGELGKPEMLKNQNTLALNKGNMAIESFEVEGIRENAENYYFSREFDHMILADLSSGQLSKEVEFDVPQGSYEPIKIILHLNQTDTLEGLRFKGKYSAPPLEDTEVEFSFFNHHEPLELMIQNQRGEKNLVFKKGNIHALEVQINLNNLFRYFNINRLVQAERIQEGGKEKIVISAQHNQEMYYELVNRIEKSTRAILK